MANIQSKKIIDVSLSYYDDDKCIGKISSPNGQVIARFKTVSEFVSLMNFLTSKK